MKIRILIVDETSFVRDALKRALRHFLKDVEVFDANNGHRALPVLRANKINLIISDWDMAEMSGRELLQWVRKEESCSKTPFIVTSDGGDRNLVMQAIKAGANDFLAKPFTPDEVEKKVSKQLARLGIKKPATPSASQNNGFGSVDVLTGGSAKPAAKKTREIRSADGFGKPKAQKPAPAKTGDFSGTAHLHFDGYSAKCAIVELSLVALVGVIKRASPEETPRLFDATSADIANASGEPIGQVKMYVHALQSRDPRPDAQHLKITLRFGDNAPEQLEQLSKAIARGR